MSLYGVGIFDLVDSRESSNRDELQLYLADSIKKFNKQYKEILAAPSEVTLGDEWQVITFRPEKLYRITEAFQQMLWSLNVELYAGLGIGTLSTTLHESIRNMDGSCFHNAREALDIVKNQTGNFITSKRNRIYFYHKNNLMYQKNETAATAETAATEEYRCKPLNISQLINVIIENNEILKSRMTLNQKNIYLDYLKYGTYRRIADNTEKKSIGNISKRLNSAEVFTIQRNGEVIESLLRYCCLTERGI